LAEIADDRAKIFAGGDHAPAANRMETDRYGFVRQQGWVSFEMTA